MGQDQMIGGVGGSWSDINLIAGILIVGAVFLLAWGGCRVLETLLKRANILDHPNARSNHTRPVPRGGGIAVIASWLAGVIAIYTVSVASFPVFLIWLLAGLTMVMAVSWWDDLRDISITKRLPVHVMAVLIALPSLPGLLFEELPLEINIVIVALLWLGFTNIFNFMDGIDGISGVQGLSICAGIIILALLSPQIAPVLIPVLVLGAALGGFLVCNAPPARIFLGDVGSIPIGFLLGWALLWLAVNGQPVAALILPLYYIVDSGWTLMRRLLRGERFWQAHSEHIFQQAVRRGMTHGVVVARIGVANLFLVFFACVSRTPESAPFALIGSVLCTGLLLSQLDGDNGK